MIDASQVSCVIVTRGNVPRIIEEVRDTLPFEDVIVWDNSQLADDQDEKVYGRYLGAAAAKNNIIAFQDDDAVIEDWPALLAAYEPGLVTCNMGSGHCAYYKPMGMALVGFGSVFDRSLIRPAFDRYFARFPVPDDLFLRECDRVFTSFNRLKVVTLPYRSLPHEETTARMWREPNHGNDLMEIIKRIRQAALGETE